ncbi:MAG: TlpA family protein disulfide reductase [Ilumatobacteraceae bacterium]
MAPTRREFLLAAGSVVLLVACGSDNGAAGTDPTSGGAATDGTGGTGTSTADTSAPEGFGVVQRFPNTPLFTPGEARLPVSLIDEKGTITSSGPPTIDGRIFTEDGTAVTDFVATRRQEGISPAYWEVRVELKDPGTYVLRLAGDDGNGASFQIVTPEQVASPVTGTAMPPFDTPTVDDHRGVEPYCSLTPDPCPLHDVTLTDALASGKPVIYMVGTPAHCQTGTCAPGLEFLVAEHERLGDQVMMVHADVYADDKASKVAPAVTALKVDYEPVIYFIDTTGTIVDRLDGVWDAGELRERLDLFVKR